MQQEEVLILALLKEDYPEIPEILDRKYFDINYFIYLNFKHRTSPALFSRLLARYQELLAPETIQAFRQNIMRRHVMNKMHRRELGKAAGLLSQAGYDVTLMKGISYDPEDETIRVYGDVDILVPEEEIREIITLLTHEGYKYKGSFMISREERKDIEGQLSWNNQYQFDCPDSVDTLEVHTNLFERDRIRLEDINTLLERKELYLRNRRWNEELCCYVPSAEATLMLLCLQCSLKRSLYNDEYILRHVLDTDLLLTRGIDGEEFLFLCSEARIEYHVCFALKLYGIIKQVELPPWYSRLEKVLSGKERFLLHRHLKCLGNLWSCHRGERFLFNFTAPFIIGGTPRQRLTWLRNNILATKVQQENRYHQWGFKVESPTIYLTYLINPFHSLWKRIKRILHLREYKN